MAGFNLPPGVSVRDIDALFEEPFCEVCCKDESDCICPECPVCGVYGDENCYSRHGLLHTQAQIDSVSRWERARMGEIEEEYLDFDWYDDENPY